MEMIRLFSDPDDRVDVYNWNIYDHDHNFSRVIAKKGYLIFFDRKTPRDGVYDGRYERYPVKIGVNMGYVVIAFPENLEWLKRVLRSM